MNLINIKKIGLKQKAIMLFVSFTVINCLIVYLVILPTIKTIKNQSDLIVVQKIELEKRMSRVNNMANLSEKLKKVEPKKDTIEQTFINKNRELEFITTLEGIAEKNNVVQKINLESVKPGEQSYFKTPLNINASGEYNSLLNYIINLETLKYYINIKSLQFSSAQDQYTLVVLADTFWK